MITSTQNEVIQKLFDLLSHTQPTLVGKSEVCVKGSSLMTSNYFHGRANMSKQCRGRQLSDWWNYQKYLKGMGIYFDPNACRVTTTNPHLTLNEVWHHLSCAADWIGTPYGHEKCSIGKKIWQEADEIVHSIPQMIRDKHKTHFHERKLGSEKAARQEATVVEGRQEEHISPVQPDMATGIEQDEMLMDDPVHEKSTATSHHDNSKQNQHDRNDAGEAQDKEMVDHNAGWDRANDPRHERTKENEQQEDMEDAKSDSTVVGVEGDDKESEFALVVNQAEAVTNGTVDTA